MILQRSLFFFQFGEQKNEMRTKGWWFTLTAVSWTVRERERGRERTREEKRFDKTFWLFYVRKKIMRKDSGWAKCIWSGQVKSISERLKKKMEQKKYGTHTEKNSSIMFYVVRNERKWFMNINYQVLDVFSASFLALHRVLLSSLADPLLAPEERSTKQKKGLWELVTLLIWKQSPIWNTVRCS